MNAPAAATRAGVKNFGRTYDHEKATIKLDVMGKPDSAILAEWAKLPPEAQAGFGMKAYADYLAAHGNAAVKGTATAPGDLDKGIAAVKEAIEDAEGGEVEFSDGLGLGMSSSPKTRLVGRALVEEGFKFVSNKGTKYEFEGDVGKAIAAMKALYADTVAPQVGEKDGKPVMGDTGRQIFRKIAKNEKIAARLALYEKAKAAPVLAEGALG